MMFTTISFPLAILVSLVSVISVACAAPADPPKRLGTDIRYCDLKDFGKISFAESKSKGCQEKKFEDKVCYNLTFMDDS
jgi:hypothetical protein